MNIVIGLLVGGLFFMSNISAYILGLKHKKIISSGNIPKLEIPLVEPIKEVIQHFEDKKEEKKAEIVREEYWR